MPCLTLVGDQTPPPQLVIEVDVSASRQISFKRLDRDNFSHLITDPSLTSTPVTVLGDIDLTKTNKCVNIILVLNDSKNELEFKPGQALDGDQGQMKTAPAAPCGEAHPPQSPDDKQFEKEYLDLLPVRQTGTGNPPNPKHLVMSFAYHNYEWLRVNITPKYVPQHSYRVRMVDSHGNLYCSDPVIKNGDGTSPMLIRSIFGSYKVYQQFIESRRESKSP